LVQRQVRRKPKLHVTPAHPSSESPVAYRVRPPCFAINAYSAATGAVGAAGAGRSFRNGGALP
jgi:hypothetical protein